MMIAILKDEKFKNRECFYSIKGGFRTVSSRKGSAEIFQFRIEIKEITPPIWRTILVPSNSSIHDFHLMIQAAFGWYNYHLYEFTIGKRKFVAPEQWDETPGDAEDSHSVSIGELNLREGQAFGYTYDFGDMWEHKITVQKILPPDKNRTYPCCIRGKRSAPPEDCGGAYGYYETLRKASDLSDPGHDETAEWLGDYDPEKFILEDANRAVREYKRMENY